MRHASKEYNFVSVENLHDFLPSLTGCCSVHNLPFRCNKVGQNFKRADFMEKESINHFSSISRFNQAWVLHICYTILAGIFNAAMFA